MQFHDFSNDMFSSAQKIDFTGFKNGNHEFRVLPPYAPNQLFYKVDLHWGYTDENGRKKVLKCTKYTHKMCPICDEVDRLTAEIDLIKKSPSGFNSPEDMEAVVTEKLKKIGDIKRKPTYLWNILNAEGGAKVLQLSWNGHDPLYNKIKFLWETQKINVTDPRASHMLWCSRTGTNAKTRYQYELIANSARALENLPALIDLSKVYADSTPAELKKIVEDGYVGNPNQDPNDRSFVADMTNTPAHTPPQNVPSQPVQPMPAQQQTVGNVAQPAMNQQYAAAHTQVSGNQNPSNTGTNVQQAASPSSQQLPNVDDEIAKMQKILQG